MGDVALAKQVEYQRAPDDYFGGSRRFVDPRTGLTVVNVHAGDCFVTNKPGEVAATVLGSCISACIRDPVAAVGGMNHFLLPSGKAGTSEPARFGVHAMQQLVDELLKMGAQRERLEAKLFGGGHVIESSLFVGEKNGQFARDYLKQEKIALLSTDIGGSSPRKLRYEPLTGRAYVRKLRRDDDFHNVEDEEGRYHKQLLRSARRSRQTGFAR